VAKKGAPNYTQLAHDVVRSSEEPLTFEEVFDRINERQPITTKNPKGTIRNALTNLRLVKSIGDGCYGYFPHLIKGSLFRLPLTEKKPAHHPLTFTGELNEALWPAYFESGSRRSQRPARVRLPSGEEVELECASTHVRESEVQLPPSFSRWLITERAQAGDDLLFRVLEADDGLYEVQLQRRSKRDEQAIAGRNRQIADAAYDVFRYAPEGKRLVSEVGTAVMAQGLYRDPVPPDSFIDVISADKRFLVTEMGLVMRVDHLTPDERESILKSDREFREELDRIMAGGADLLTQASPAMMDRRAMEKSLADIGRIVEDKKFGSLEEVNAFLRDLTSDSDGRLPSLPPATALERAQDLMYEAWDARGPMRVKLAKQALEISPDCADAYVLLAEETSRTPEEARELYAKGVAAGERALGKGYFEQEAGHFWGMIETRPYMRARLGLAQALWELWRRHESVDHLWEMLRLNPGDNQGVRYVLLSHLLKMGDEPAVNRLLERYPDDISADWWYGSALNAFRREGDGKTARKMLSKAIKSNSHVPDYLLSRKKPPKHAPRPRWDRRRTGGCMDGGGIRRVLDSHTWRPGMAGRAVVARCRMMYMIPFRS